MAVNDNPVLDIRNISKRFGETIALNQVSFALQRAEVCALLGENGAGKSTLVKCLSGITRPDSGDIQLHGQSFRPQSAIDANAHGISTAFQELSLVPSLSVALNLFLPRPEHNRMGMIPMRRLESRAADLLAHHDITDIPPMAVIRDLPLGMRQRVEIVRALSRHPTILLLDEPTAALSDRDWLFRLIEKALQDGTSILYISHKLDEVRHICRRCVVLRNGELVLDDRVANLTDEAIFHSMVGRSAPRRTAPGISAMHADVPPTLQVKNFSGPGIEDVSFSMYPGEILGVAALEGQGQSQLFKALVGLSPLKGGKIVVNGTAHNIRSPRQARRVGLALVPEERKSEGIFAHLATIANISLPVVDRIGRFHLMNGRNERRLVAEAVSAVNLMDEYLPLKISALSGGNQQKAILARALMTGAKCLLLFDPTRGVDVGTKQNIYKVMQKFAQDGGSILFYSTELEEITRLCDRCFVLYRNSIAGELTHDDISPDRLIAIASGFPPDRVSAENTIRGSP